MPDRCGRRGLDAHHAVGIDATGIATAKQLRMFNGAAHAHSAHKLIYRFRKWPTQEAHTRRAAKCCDASAGADDDASTPRQSSTLAHFVQMANDRVRLLGTPTVGLNNHIDACSCAFNTFERPFNDGHRLAIEHIFNSEYNAVHNAAGIIRLQINRAGERGARKLSIGGDGILQVPEQKLKIGAIGNADIRNGLQRFGTSPRAVVSMPPPFRLVSV